MNIRSCARLRVAGLTTAALALLVGSAQAQPAGTEPVVQLATLMQGSEGELRDAMESDFVPKKKRTAGCRSFSSESGTARQFRNSRLVTARPHAQVHMGPGKHFCVTGHVVGRNLRLRVVGETTGWFQIRLGDVEGWVPAASLRRAL